MRCPDLREAGVREDFNRALVQLGGKPIAPGEVSPRQPYIATLTAEQLRAYHLAYYYWNQARTADAVHSLTADLAKLRAAVEGAGVAQQRAEYDHRAAALAVKWEPGFAGTGMQATINGRRALILQAEKPGPGTPAYRVVVSGSAQHLKNRGAAATLDEAKLIAYSGAFRQPPGHNQNSEARSMGRGGRGTRVEQPTLEYVGDRKFSYDDIDPKGPIPNPSNGDPLHKGETERTLICMPCSMSKIGAETPVPLIELYDGPLWQTLRQHLGAVPVKNILVLSGKHGWESASTNSLPYDEKISKEKVDELIRLGFGGQRATTIPGTRGQTSPSPSPSQLTLQGTDYGRRPFKNVILAAGPGTQYARGFNAIVTQMEQAGLIDPADASIVSVSGGIGRQRQMLASYLQEINAKAATAGHAVETVAPGEKGLQRQRKDKEIKKYLSAKRPAENDTQRIISYRTEATVAYNSAFEDDAPQPLLDFLRGEHDWAVERLRALDPEVLKNLGYKVEPGEPAPLELTTYTEKDLAEKEKPGAAPVTPLTGPEPPLLTTPEGTAPPRDVEEQKVPTQQLKLFQRGAEYTVPRLGLGDDGNVTLLHGTTAANAELIRAEGFKESDPAAIARTVEREFDLPEGSVLNHRAFQFPTGRSDLAKAHFTTDPEIALQYTVPEQLQDALTAAYWVMHPEIADMNVKDVRPAMDEWLKREGRRLAGEPEILSVTVPWDVVGEHGFGRKIGLDEYRAAIGDRLHKMNFSLPIEALRGANIASLERAAPSDVDRAAEEADGHNASEAQQQAGNYQKGHVQLGPEGATMEGAIETPAGESRRPEWPKLKDHYGYFKGTIGYDKDHLDFFIQQGTPSNLRLTADGKVGWVYVVNQTKGPEGTGDFDEHKVLLGVTRGITEARDMYLRNYEAGWSRYSSITPISWAAFRRWATDQSRRGPKGGRLTISAADRFDQEARNALPEAGRADRDQGPVQGQLDLHAAPTVPGTTAKTLDFRLQVELEQQASVKLPKGRIQSWKDAVRAFRQLNRWPRERFQAIGIDKAGKPIAFYDLFAGTITQTSVYPREIWTALYMTPGVQGVWFAHNHPGGLATPSAADTMLTGSLRELLQPGMGVEYKGHVIIAGDRAVDLDSGERTDVAEGDTTTHTAVPVLERVIKRQGPAGESLLNPQAARDYFRALKPQATGLLIMDAQHRVMGWWEISPDMLEPGDFARLAAPVLRMIGSRNPAAAFLYSPSADLHRAGYAQRLAGLKHVLQLAEVKLLDAFAPEAEGSERLLSFAERGLMEEGATYMGAAKEPGGAYALRDFPINERTDVDAMRFEKDGKVIKGLDEMRATMEAMSHLSPIVRSQPMNPRQLVDVLMANGWKPVRAQVLAFRPRTVEDAYHIAPRGRGMHAQGVWHELRGHPVARGLGNRFSVVQSARDLPQRIVEHLVNIGGMNLVKGFASFQEDRIYLVADNLAPGEAEQTLLHEAVGHLGMLGVLPEESGKRFKESMLDIYRSRAGAIREQVTNGFLRPYHIDLTNENHQVLAAMEYVAHMAERGEEPTLWQKIVAAMRSALRAMGLVRDYSDNDIRRLLRLSRESLTNNPADTFNGMPAWQLGEQGPLWYSGLERAVEGIKQEKAPASQWLNTLKQRPGVKPDEIEWSGLGEWLQAREGNVSKAEVLGFLRANGVHVGETILGGVEVGDSEMRRLLERRDAMIVALDAEGFDVEFDQRGHLEAVADRRTGAMFYANPEQATVAYNMMPAEARGFGDLPSVLRRAARELARIAPTTAQFGNHDIGGATRYRQYSAPGGKDYRELLITLPAEKVAADQLAAAARGERAPQGWVQAGGELFQSGHFDMPNILAHVRFDTRTDTEGKKVLFIEEIQSDWAEKGREKGFIRPAQTESEKRAESYVKGKPWSEISMRDLLEAGAPGDFVNEWGRAVWQGEHRPMGKVPRAPFVTKTPQWTALVLKRAIRWAADHGFDRVAWTTGDQQNARYGLEKHISRLSVWTDLQGNVTAARAYGPTRAGGRTAFDLDVTDREGVEALVGRAVVEKILSTPAVPQPYVGKEYLHELSGVDLRTGGEAMREFYDHMVPNIANDVLKKVGGERVKKIGLKLNLDAPIAGQDVLESRGMWEPEILPTWRAMTQAEREQAIEAHRQIVTEHHGFDITPAMREFAVQGMPLFSLREQPGLKEIYGVREGRLLGFASRPYGTGPWNVYIATGTNETLFNQGQSRRLQAGSIADVQRMFNAAGLELKVIKPRDIPVPDRAIFDRDWVAPNADNWLRRSIIYFQNRLLLPRLYEETIAREVGPIPEVAQAHREARLAHPRAAGKIADFDHDYSEPIVQLMKQHRLTMKDVGEYLYARHAPERNAAIEEINPENKAGSGMSTARAAEVMDQLRARLGERFQYLDQIGALADRINHFREEVLIDKGLAPREAVELLRKKYQHYVPLKELPDDDYARGETGAGFRVNKLLNAAFGRFTEAQAEFILPGLVSQAKGTIAAGENAEVLRAFLKLVQYAPNPQVWKIERDEFRPKLDRETGMVVWAPRRPDGRNVISVPVNGKRVTIQVADYKLANAFNTSGAQFPEALSWVSAITRFYASMATAANPEFVITNLMRDFQEAMIRVGGEQGTKLAASAAKDIPGAFWGAFSGLRAKGQLTPEASSWHGWYRRYIEAGGHIAYRGIQDAESQHKDFLARLAEIGIYPESESINEWIKNRGKRLWHFGPQQVAALVSDVNGAVENATRLAIFKNAVEYGMGEKDAAMVARNATVDFNLRGEATGIYNALYMFFNANVQGSAILIRSVAHSPKVRVAALVLLAMGALMDRWNRQWADKDEGGRSWYDLISEDIKQRNLVIMGPDKKNAILIPLPFGFGIFHNMGRHISSMMPKEAGGAGEHFVDAARNTFVAAVNAFSPFGNVPTSWLGMIQLISPTMLDPIVQRATNRNWMDKPIFPERRFGKPQAAAETYYPGTPDYYVRAAEWLNRATGGNEVRPGWADMYPNVMQHWVTSVFGSAGATYSRIAAFLGAKATGQEQEMREVPFLRRFFYEPKDFELSHRFYDYVNQTELAHFEREAALRRGDRDQAETMRGEYKAEEDMFGSAQLAERQVAQHSRQISALRNDKRLDDEKRKLLIERESEARRQVMSRFAAQFERRQEAAQ